MKKSNSIALVFAILILITTGAVAQIDNLCNMSAEWVRSSARNAANDATDIVVYNPAGITSLKDGMHINFSNQSMWRKPNHSYDFSFGEGVKNWEQQGADLFLPNFFATYKKDNWALYTGIFISGGGASVNYPDGSITTDLIGMQVLMSAQGAYTQIKDPSLKASSVYSTTTIGATYAISKAVSFSLAARHITAKNTVEAAMTLTSSPVDMPDQLLELDARFKATGMGGVASININPFNHLALTTRYESQVNLDFKTKTIEDGFGVTVDGASNARDLPAVLAFGAAYEVNSRIKVYSDVNYYFQKNADWGKSSMLTEEKPVSQLAGDAVMYALGFEYKIAPKLIASMGGAYSQFNFSDKAGYYTSMGSFEAAPGNNYNLNTGLAYKANDMITINAGMMHVAYEKDQKIKALMAQPLDVDVTVNNSLNLFAVGIDLTF